MLVSGSGNPLAHPAASSADHGWSKTSRRENRRGQPGPTPQTVQYPALMRRASEEVGAEFAESLPGEPWSAVWTADKVIETLEPLASDERKSRIQSVIDQRLASVTVLMDAPHDPHNG